MGSLFSFFDSSLACSNMQRPNEDENEKCNHKYCEFWGDRIMCIDCKPALHIQKKTFPDVYRREMTWRKKLGEEDHSNPDDMANRAVTIQFLLDFCNHYNLWDVSTRDVRRDFVVPMTSEKRCRFVDLPCMINIVGPSQIFVSHTWSGKFGDIVAAVCDGRSDYSVRVWLDIFATLQWPSTKLTEELKFEMAIQKSASFLIVCPALSEHLKNISYTKLWNSSTQVEKDIRSIVPFFRGWCIYELFFAMNTEGVTVIVKCGGHVSKSAASKYSPHPFKDDPEGIFRIAALIDINRADFSQPSDKELILGKARAFRGGLDGLNVTVKRKLGGAYFSSPYPLVHAFASRKDECSRSDIKMNAANNIIGVAAEGCSSLLDEILRSNKSLVRNCDVNDRNALMAAAAAGHRPCLRSLLSYGANLKSKDKSGHSALHFGSLFCNQSSLEFLLDNGVDVNSKDGDGMTALMFAAMAGHVSCVKYLVRREADVLAVNNDGTTALMLAALGGHLPCLSALVIKGGGGGAKIKDDNSTALLLAAWAGHSSCIEFLVKCNADVNVKRSEDGASALMLAAWGGHFPCVAFLVQSGADIHAKDKKGVTALMLAAWGGSLSCVEFLIEKKVDVNAIDRNGGTALMLAAWGGHFSCVDFLVRRGANVHAKRKDDHKTARMLASEKHHSFCVKLLR